MPRGVSPGRRWRFDVPRGVRVRRGCADRMAEAFGCATRCAAEAFRRRASGKRDKRESGNPLSRIVFQGQRPKYHLEIVQVKVAPSAPAVFTVITVLPPTVFAVMWLSPVTLQTPSSVSVTLERIWVGSDTDRV